MRIPYKNKPVSTITPKQFYNLVERIKSFKNIEDLEEKILFLEILFFTGLRHSHATFLRQNGIDIEKIQQRLGYSTILVTLRYTHAKLREEEDVIDVIEKSCYPLSRGEENERNKSDEFNIQ